MGLSLTSVAIARLVKAFPVMGCRETVRETVRPKTGNVPCVQMERRGGAFAGAFASIKNEPATESGDGANGRLQGILSVLLKAGISSLEQGVQHGVLPCHCIA